jgi:hypothetical protein
MISCKVVWNTVDLIKKLYQKMDRRNISFGSPSAETLYSRTFSSNKPGSETKKKGSEEGFYGTIL